MDFRMLFSYIDIMLLLCAALFLYSNSNLGSLASYLPQRKARLTTVKVGDPNAELGMIARLNSWPDDTYSWICRDIRTDSERFLIKPFEEVFDASLEVMVVSSGVFEARHGQTLTFKECFAKTITTRTKIWDSFAEGVVKSQSWTAVRFQKMNKKEIRMTVLDLIEEEDQQDVKPSRIFSMKIPLPIEKEPSIDSPVCLYIFQDQEPKHRRSISITSSEDVKLLSAFFYTYNPNDNHTLHYYRKNSRSIGLFHFSDCSAEGYSSLSKHYFNMIQAIQKREELGEIVKQFSAIMAADHIASYTFDMSDSQYPLETSVEMLLSLFKSEFKLDSRPFLCGSFKDSEWQYFARPLITGTLHYFEKKDIKGKNSKLSRIRSEKDMNDIKIESDIFGFVQTGPKTTPIFGDKVIVKRGLDLDISISNLKTVYDSLFSPECGTDFWAKHLVDLKFQKENGKFSIWVGLAYISIEEFDKLKDDFWAKLISLLSRPASAPLTEAVEDVKELDLDDFENDFVDEEFEEALRNFGSVIPDIPLTWKMVYSINGMFSKSSVFGFNSRTATTILHGLSSLFEDSSSWLESFYLRLEPTRFPFGKPTEQRLFQLRLSIHPSSPFEVLRKVMADVASSININEGHRAVVEISFTIDVSRNSFVLEVLYYQNAATSTLLSNLSALKLT